MVFITSDYEEFKKHLVAFFYIWVFMLHLQPKVVLAFPINPCSILNRSALSLSDFKNDLSARLSNPCGTEKNNCGSEKQDNTDVQRLLETIESSSKTGLSDFNEKVLKNFLENNFNKSLAMKYDHHVEWKHRHNPNLHPNGTQLEIEFSKDLFDFKKISTIQAARNFNIKNTQELIETLHNCDDRLQRLLVAFFGMIINLDNSDINFRNESATNIAREDYANATNIIRIRMCEVRYVLSRLHNSGNVASEINNELQEAREMKNLTFNIVGDDNIFKGLSEADIISDWVNMRQLYDQLNYMAQIFSIWAREINVNDPS